MFAPCNRVVYVIALYPHSTSTQGSRRHKVLQADMLAYEVAGRQDKMATSGVRKVLAGK